MKKALKIIWIVFVTLAALLFAAWILIQTPVVQTAVAKRLISSLEQKIDGTVQFSKIHLRPFNAIVVKDLVVLDGHPSVKDGEPLDTILRSKSLVATFSLKGLVQKKGLLIKRASLKDGSFLLTMEKSGTNVERFMNLKAWKTQGAKKSGPGLQLDLNRLQFENIRFRMIDLKPGTVPVASGLDWKDLDILIARFSAKNLKLAGGEVTGTIEDLAAADKSGYAVKYLSADTRINSKSKKAEISKLKFKDSWSWLNVPEATFGTDSTSSSSSLASKLLIAAKLTDSRLDSRSLSYFTPALKDKDLALDIEDADIEGSIDDLIINRLDFKENGSGTEGGLYARLTGLPEIQNLNTDFEIEDLTFTTAGLEKLMTAFSPSSKIKLSEYAAGETLTFNGSGNGSVSKMNVKGELSSAIGSATADLDIRNLTDKKVPVQIAGSVATDGLNIGKIANIQQLGACTMHSSFNADLGKGQTSITIDTLQVSKLAALGYNYSDIAAAGTYSEKAFNGRIICNDPNLNFLFQGIFTLSDRSKNGLYKFYANLGYADLNALHLDKRGISKISGQVNANYMNISKGDVIGEMSISNLTLENRQGRHDIGNLSLRSHSNDNIKRMNLSSSFADGSYVGTKPLVSLAKDLKELTLQRELPALFKDTTSVWKGNAYDLNLNFHDSRDILSFAMPGLYIADSTKVRLKVDKDGNVTASVKSPRLAFGRNYLKNASIAIDNKESSINGIVTSKEMSVTSMRLLNNSIMLYGKDNRVGLGLSFDNETELADRGELYLTGELEKNSKGALTMKGKTLPSNIYYNDLCWKVSSSDFSVKGKDIEINDLTAACADQSIKVDGGFSFTGKDTLSVELQKFDMSLFNKFMKEDLGIKGLATGRAIVTSPWKTNPGLMMNLLCDSTKISGLNAGTIRLASTMEDNGKLQLAARNSIGGAKTFDLKGDYNTGTKEMDMLADLDSLDVGYLAPVLTSVFSEMGGPMSGKIRIKGKISDPDLSSEDARFDNVLLKVAYTNVPYRLSGPFHVSNEGLFFDNIAATDRYGGTGEVSGGILLNHLSNPRMDTRIKVNEMECLNTDESDNQSFYGKVSATGSLNITGPFNALLLDLNARTVKEGSIHIPIDNASNVSSSNLLTFKEIAREVHVDPYDLMMNKLNKSGNSGQDLACKLRIIATPGVQAFVDVDRTAGNTLTGRGQGTIDIDVRPYRDLFTINGDYTIEEGNFHFNAMNIAQRDFTLADGSSIRFNGDIMDSDLNINGDYTTKASIATLISDTTSVSSRRTVNCGIGISGKLREPKLTFSIDVPDLDPTTKSKVESALNTDDKVQRQLLSLLISGGFMPDERSGVVNNTNVLYSNVAEIMAGQLNNILQKLDIPLDLGLNYQSTGTGTNIFDVAVSTQLFNNRVLVNGAFGNREYGSSSQGEVTGDLDIDVKLDKPGQLRLNLFSHSADDYTSYLDNTQRNGVGIAYQKEFNTLKEFVRDLFTSRKKKERRMRENPLPDSGNEVNVIRINE